MKHLKVRAKKSAVLALVALNIFAAGAVAGAFQGYHYAKGQSKTTEQAVQAALKALPVAQAATQGK